MDFENLDINDFNYFLPPDRIAQFPLPNREEANLLVFHQNDSKISHHKFYELPDILDHSFAIVRNNTKVFPARIFLKKITGGNVELLLEHPQNKKLPEIVLRELPPQRWICIMKGKNLNPGLKLKSHFSNDIEITATILSIYGSKRIVELDWKPQNLSLSELLNEIGKIPLPEYIKREPNEQDRLTYQTIFAQKEGSIAAPTAGLHFTENVVSKLQLKGIDILDITLHVGSGTFVPLKTNKVIEHKMHSELFEISLSFLKKIHTLMLENKKIIAVGTTTVRTLESIYWLANSPFIDINYPIIEQWIWKNKTTHFSKIKSIEKLIQKMEKNNFEQLVGETQLMIIPGFEYNFVDGIITNFHLPKSTLLLLVAAFVGRDNMQMIYHEALEKNYRFLSYGDASLLLK